jgi:hypothetical protein
MALRIHTQIAGDVFILLCDGRIVFGDEGAVLRERVVKMLTGTPKIVVNLHGRGLHRQRRTGHARWTLGLGEKPRWRTQAGFSQPAH